VLPGGRDHHATIFVPAAAAGWIAGARRRWDPVMAARIAAHVTLIYPEEAPAVSLLAERLEGAAAAAVPFRLRIGGIARDASGGVYVSVEDVDGGYCRLREDVLRPPFRPLAFAPHVTIAHPRTSARGRAFADDRLPGAAAHVFGVDDVSITGFDGAAWITLARYPLGGLITGRPRAADRRRPRGPSTR
jgi:2'-5' RNA ligase